MLGSEEEPRDVLEYLVIERHLVNPYGMWRLHGKIVPAWAPPKDPIIKVSVLTCSGLLRGTFEQIDRLWTSKRTFWKHYLPLHTLYN